jgi:hypothetical protein
MRSGKLAALIVLGAVLAACSGGTTRTTLGHTTGATAASPTPGVPSLMHTTAGGSPGTPGPPRGGTASLTVTGAARATLELPRLTNRAFAPGGGFAFVWGDGRGDSLGVGGPVFAGSSRTTNQLVVTILLAGRHPLLVSSSAGECGVSLRPVSAGRLRGRLRCRGIRTPRGAVAATGRFEAPAGSGDGR